MNKIPLPTIVLFDMDGTTVRHVHPWLLNILELIDDGFYKTSRFIARLRRGREMIDFSDEPAGKKRLLVHRALHKMRRKEVDQIVQPCPGIIPLLKFFKKNNIPVGLVSNGLGKGYGHEVLETFDLEQYFAATVFREDATKSKPHPDSLLRALKIIKEEPSKDDVVWYIGDRQKDIEAAIAARKFVECKLQPFGYGLNATVAILKHNIGVDHIIMDYTDFSLRVAEMFEDQTKDNGEKKNYRKASKSAS
jgi:phosphoglycolate phosphatase